MVDAHGDLFAILAISLIIVNFILIYMLKKHVTSSKDKINPLIFWSLTFTITYGLRSIFSFIYAEDEKFFNRTFEGYMIEINLLPLWDLPALLGTFTLNWKLL